MRSALLLIHALSASIWVLAALCMALASAALLVEGEGREDFVRKVVPVLNRLAAGGAGLLLATGIGNLMVAGAARGFHFSATFTHVLAVKITLFVLMAGALYASWRTQARLMAAPAASGRLKLLAALSAATAVMGGIALALGLWLVGS